MSKMLPIEDASEIYQSSSQEANRGLYFWEEVSLETLRHKLDEQALKVAENQAASLESRKSLAVQARSFTVLLTDLNADPVLKENGLELVSAFKLEVDKLSKRARHGEGSFLTIYKLLREAPDPVLMITRLLKEHDNAWRLLQTAYENMEVKVKDSENRIESLSKALESAKQKNENSVIEITEITDRESAARDVSLQETIKQLERNNRHIKDEFSERILYMKKQADEERGALSSQLAYVQEELEKYHSREHLLLEAEERAKRQFDDSQSITLQLAKNDRDIKKLQDELDESLDRAKRAESTLADLKKAHSGDLAASQEREKNLIIQLNETQELMNSLKKETEIELHKAKDESSELMKKIKILEGFESSDEGFEPGTYALSDDQDKLSSIDDPENADSWVLTYGRKLRAEIAQSRARVSASESALLGAQLEISNLKKALGNKQQECKRLEQDLVNAQQVVEAGRSMVRSLQGKAAPSNSGSLANLFGINRPRNDIEGVNKQMSSLEAGEETVLEGFFPEDRLLAAVQQQRSKFRSQVLARESELSLQKSTIERLQQQNQEVQRDNLALYRKLRSLQLRSGPNPVANRGSKAELEENQAESRYLDLFEKERDPFRKIFQNEEFSLCLAPIENILLGCCKSSLANKKRRIILIIYIFAIHAYFLGSIFGIFS